MTTLSPSCSARLVALVTVAVMAIAGCSGSSVKKVTVQGTISYKGELLRSGLLKFVGPGGSYSAGVIQADGTFIITDVVPGEVKVGIMETPQGSVLPAPLVTLPQKYRDPETSGVKYTITEETRELRIVIQ